MPTDRAGAGRLRQEREGSQGQLRVSVALSKVWGGHLLSLRNFSPPISSSGPLGGPPVGEEMSDGPLLQGKVLPARDRGGGRALSVVFSSAFSPAATWTGTSSHWFQDSCPPTSTCSSCEYPGRLRTLGPPQSTGGPLASDCCGSSFPGIPCSPLLWLIPFVVVVVCFCLFNFHPFCAKNCFAT